MNQTTASFKILPNFILPVLLGVALSWVGFKYFSIPSISDQATFIAANFMTDENIVSQIPDTPVVTGNTYMFLSGVGDCYKQSPPCIPESTTTQDTSISRSYLRVMRRINFFMPNYVTFELKNLNSNQNVAVQTYSLGPVSNKNVMLVAQFDANLKGDYKAIFTQRANGIKTTYATVMKFEEKGLFVRRAPFKK
jgi:hypothetical protein